MTNKGFALYKKGADLYILSVAYEYPDSRFVGFDNTKEVFKVNKLSDEQKDWLKSHDPRQHEKTKNHIFLKDYYLSKVLFQDFPTGKPYTQLPGGGGVYKETRKYNFIYDLFDNETVLRAIDKYGTTNEARNIIKQIIREEIDKLVYTKKKNTPQSIGFQMLEKEAKKHNTSEELLRSGGFSTEALDLAAFGFTEESVKSLMPKQLSIKWKDDFENVIWEIANNQKKGISKTEWAKKINLSEPIDVSFDGRKFYIEDGHHRYCAAKILNVPLSVNLEIKANPIAKLSDKGYDEFHREFFDKVKEIREVKLKQQIPTAAFTAVSIEDESEKKKISDVYDSLKAQGKIPERFFTRPAFKDGTLDYHMTIGLGELPLRFKRDLDKEVVLNIETFGISDDAVALGVSGDYFSDNEFQHITLGFKYAPSDSKLIKNWEPLEHPFTVRGVIREFRANKEVIKRGVFDEANQIEIGNFQAQAPPAGNGSIFPKEKD